MDAAELLRGETPFIADTSALWWFSSLPAAITSLVKQAMDEDRLWITPIVRMEILYSARSTSEYISSGITRIPANRRYSSFLATGPEPVVT